MTVRSLILAKNEDSSYHKSLEFVKTTKKPFNRELAETILPILMYIDVAMIIGRILLLLSSIKFFSIGKVYFAYQMVYFMVANTYPDDCGNYRLQYINGWEIFFYLCFLTDFIPGAIISIAGQAYIAFFIEPNLYMHEITLGEFFLQVFT